VVARTLVSRFPSLEALSTATAEDLERVEGIGPQIAQSVVDWFDRPRHQEVLRKLRAAGVRSKADARATPAGATPLSGLTFVITGTLPTMSRDQARELIETAGGKVTESVSKKTDYLVLGESPGSKLEKAQSLGVKIVGGEELRRLVGG
jgi:DNA ligase (NAD+)